VCRARAAGAAATSRRAVRSMRWSRSCARSPTGRQIVLNCSNGCRQLRQ
jgi:hypothetical protein